MHQFLFKLSEKMSNVFVLFWAVFCTVDLVFSDDSLKIVDTENGRIAGAPRGNYYAFEGIRFADPPVGENRFKPPQPYAEYWENIRNTTSVGPPCLQWNPFVPSANKVVGNEDCLFGNVYTPTKKPNPGYKFPVIVHIHGGALQFADATLSGPEHIMRRGNFVFASFNFRLGILGFLSTQSSVVPGNMGFKDQVMALKWVQRNIAAFEGDPSSVTLTGFSSGAASVHLHYMSPLSTGLFHRGISHSGTATAEYVLAKNPLQRTLAVAELVGCSNPDQQGMIDCIRSKPGPDLVRTVSSLTEKIGAIYAHPFVPYAGVVEEEHDGAFITMTPREYLKKRRVQKLPWLTSVVKDEGVFLTADLFSNETIAKINNNWNHYTTLLIDANSTDPTFQNRVASELKTRFFDGQPLSKENFHQLTKVISQRYFHCAMSEAIRLQRKATPVYSYFYNFKLPVGAGSVNLGIGHGEDIMLLYSSPGNSPSVVNISDEGKLMSEKLLDMYATFAKKGIPKFNNKCLTRSKTCVKYMVIDSPVTVRQNVADPICDEFWKEGF